MAKKKTATQYINSLNKRGIKVDADIAKITAVLELGKGAVIGGYAMFQKLKKQKKLLEDLKNTIVERVELFKKSVTEK